jgi:hypothetical protein
MVEGGCVLLTATNVTSLELRWAFSAAFFMVSRVAIKFFAILFVIIGACFLWVHTIGVYVEYINRAPAKAQFLIIKKHTLFATFIRL